MSQARAARYPDTMACRIPNPKRASWKPAASPAYRSRSRRASRSGKMLPNPPNRRRSSIVNPTRSRKYSTVRSRYCRSLWKSPNMHDATVPRPFDISRYEYPWGANESDRAAKAPSGFVVLNTYPTAIASARRGPCATIPPSGRCSIEEFSRISTPCARAVASRPWSSDPSRSPRRTRYHRGRADR